jgi:four helix bundle protein
MRDYKKIEAWKLADDLAATIYSCTRSFPREEIYGLTSQLRRAAVSVPTNIVEGSTRESQREYLHFLHISRGSLSETEYLLSLAKRLGYVNESDFTAIAIQLRRTFACLHGLTSVVSGQAVSSHRVEEDQGSCGFQADSPHQASLQPALSFFD